MGAKLSSCFNDGASFSQREHQPAPVRVIAADGSLKELPSSPCVAVSDFLGAEAAFFFVCNSDALYFNEPPPALATGELLQPGQIYFVLPAAVLGRPLSSADMASLAVRASTALVAGRANKRRGGKKKKVRVMPVHGVPEDGEDVFFNEKLNERTLGDFAVAMTPVKKHEKLVARSRLNKLKRALSIIQEMAE
uniref:Uncharacterized protein n=1 Tax=Avena sativa TaxID=4498 RepID=A0ACD5YPR6_AVESA